MNPWLVAILPSLLTLALTVWWQRVEQTKTALVKVQSDKLVELEADMHACHERFHALDVRLAKAETEAEGMSGAMDSLREFIDERFVALNTRIDDVLRRRSDPPPKGRR